jgi:hypothetical protein
MRILMHTVYRAEIWADNEHIIAIVCLPEPGAEITGELQIVIANDHQVVA